MRKDYLHLCVYRCEKCAGPVAKAWAAIRENEISKETETQQIGAVCLACGHQQSKAVEENSTRHFTPVEWKIPAPAALELKTGVEIGPTKESELTGSSKR
jgi:hypothetical protein